MLFDAGAEAENGPSASSSTARSAGERDGVLRQRRLRSAPIICASQMLAWAVERQVQQGTVALEPTSGLTRLGPSAMPRPSG